MMKDDPNIWTIVAGALGVVVGIWLGLTPMVQIFVVLLLADVLTGLLAGGKDGALDSEISYRGMRKKGVQMVLIAVLAYVGEHPRVDMPLGDMMAGFFSATELLSIIENAGRLGVVIPESITRALARLSAQDPPRDI